MLFPSGTPVAALTGTADKTTQEVIKTSLAMKDPLVIYVSPSRTNLRFSVKKVAKDKHLSELDWLVNILSEKGKECPKTLIFCNTMNDIAKVVNYLLQKLVDFAYNDTKDPESCYIGIYHSNSWQECKDCITKSLKENGVKTVIVATTSLCMGVNFPDIRYIINWGAARSILDMHQQAGRAGRDGSQSHILTVFHGQQIGPCEPEVKEFVRAKGCLRVAAYQSLDSTIQPLMPFHDCCSYCAVLCKCNGDSCSALVPEHEKRVLDEHENVVKDIKQREVTEEEREELKVALWEVLKDMQGVGLHLCGIASHGFSRQLINDVAENCQFIFAIDDIVGIYPVYSISNALRILEVIQEMFGDIPNLDETLELINFPTDIPTYQWFDFDDCDFNDSDEELYEATVL